MGPTDRPRAPAPLARYDRPMWRPVRAGLLLAASFTAGAVSASAVSGGSPSASALMAGLGAVGSARASGAGRSREDPYNSLAIYARVLGYVERSYVEPIPVESLVRASIQGLMSRLDGPSAYLEPEAFQALKEEARAEFGGVGVRLAEVDGRIVIVEVEPDTPAMRADLQPGTVLIDVDGWAVTGRSLTQIAERIIGPPGTSVELRLLLTEEADCAGKAPCERVARLVRAPILRSTVIGRRFGPFGYLRLIRFGERTAYDLRRALDRVSEARALAGVVLDLRGNPGGLLEQAVAVADNWLDSGPVVATAGRDRPEETARAHAEGTEPSYPLAVLVDERTASAAEIVAGALKDRGRARLFGARTFGKGSVQTVIELEDGSALKLTVARYFTPSGRPIDGTGIDPHEVIGVPPSAFRAGTPELDPPLEAALRWMAARTGRRTEPEAARSGGPGRRPQTRRPDEGGPEELP